MNHSPKPQLSKRTLFGLVGSGCAAGAVLIYAFYIEQRNWLRDEQWQMLTTMADTQTASILRWRRSVIGDAQVISTNTMMANAIRDSVKPFADRSAARRLRSWFEQIKTNSQYDAVLLFDASGVLRLSSDPVPAPVQQEASGSAVKVLKNKDPVLNDFQISSSGLIHLSVFAPLYGEGGNAIAAIGLGIDPMRSLYPRLQTWPIPSQSGEIFLVRREGDSVVYLSELRHRKGTALRFRLPVASPGLLAARAVLGASGPVEGVDYRGVPVLGAVRRIPDSPWYLIAKIDQFEAYAKLGSRTQAFAIIAVLVVILGGCVLLLVWSRRESLHYSQLYASEMQRRGLASRYDYLQRFANDAILLISDNGRIVEANKRAVERYGYARDKLLTLNIRDLREPSALGSFEEQWRASGSPNGTVYETVHRRADGSSFPVEVSSRVIELDRARFRQSIIRDISERKQAEEALRLSEQRVRLKLDSILSPEGDLGDLELEDIIDAPAFQSLMNDFYRLTHIPMAVIDLKGKVLVGAGWQSVCTKFHRVHPEALQNCLESDMQLAQGVRPGEFKLYKCKNHMWDIATPLVIGGKQFGNIFSGQFFFEDEPVDRGLFQIQATRYGFDEAEYVAAVEAVPRLSRKVVDTGMACLMKLGHMLSVLSYSNIALARAQEQFRRLNTELEQRVSERTAQLEASNKELEAFSYSVSHDLRAPLRSVEGFAKILLRDYRGKLLDEKAVDYMNRMSAASQRMGHLIADLLMLSRITRQDLSPERVDLSEIATSIATELRSRDPQRVVGLQVEPGLIVEADPHLIRIALDNLLGNAWKFTGNVSAPSISFGALHDEGPPAYYIRDNGDGFDMAYADQLFVPFQRLHRTEEFEGTGIGLATVQRVIRRHGGRLWGEGKPGQGATFYFTLGAA